MMRARLPLVILAAVVVGLAGAPPTQADPRPENGQITFAREFNIWAANPDGTAQRRLTTVPSFFSDWSPGGQRIAFDFVDDNGEMHIATMSPDGQDVRQLTFGPAIQEVPKWSADGRLITFDASPTFPDDPTFHTSIWTMNSDGSNPRQITTDGFDVEPVFSPDGRQIAFGRITGFSPQGQLEAIYVVNVDGTGLHQVLAPRPALEHPDWSPDGRWISFNIAPEAFDAPDSGSIMVIRPNGRNVRVLRAASDQLRFFKPVWSPDGRKLLTGCFDTEAQADQICTMTSSGHKVDVVIAGTAGVSTNFPAWGSLPPEP